MRSIQLAELTDSRILYEKRAPVFGFFIIALALVAVLFALVWSSATTKPSVVQAAGAVESENRTYVMSSVSGKIVDVLTPNGASVERDDTMIVVESVELAVEKQSVDAQSQELNQRLALHDRYRAALENDTNEFDPNNPDESSFYYEFESLDYQLAQVRADPDSLRALGYSELEIENVLRRDRLKRAELLNTALSAAADEAAEIRQQIDTLAIRAAALESQELAYTVEAPETGEVYLNPKLKPGAVISAGEPLGTIAAPDAARKVTVYLAVPDRQLVSVGDKVRVSVSGLPAPAYDKIDGEVTSIDSDVTTMTSGAASATTVSNESVFGVTVELDRYYVQGQAGERHEIGNGTAVQVDLVYDEVSYLQYALGLLGFTSGGSRA